MSEPTTGEQLAALLRIESSCETDLANALEWNSVLAENLSRIRDWFVDSGDVEKFPKECLL